MHDDFKDAISREDIEDALAALESGEVHTFGPSTSYDVLYDGKRYPPKAVVGLAARRVLGRPLRSDEFSGGERSWSFRLLRKRGFTIVKKTQNEQSLETPPFEDRIREKLQLGLSKDALLREAFELLAFCIEAADEDRPDGWYLRETDHGLRLMVGRLLACSLRRSRLRLSVAGPISEEHLTTLGAEVEDDFKWIPGAKVLQMPLDKAALAQSLLKDAIDAFIDGAMLRVKRSVSIEDHEPAAIQYISAVLGRDIPNPEAPEPSAIDGDVEFDDNEIEVSREPLVRGRAPIFENGQRSIASLISDIERGVIALPDLQRPFVWEDTKVRDLLDSLFVGFPVGTLVFWYTSDEREARALGADRPELRATTLVIDGQQRLTSLYAIIKGACN